MTDQKENDGHEVVSEPTYVTHHSSGSGGDQSYQSNGDQYSDRKQERDQEGSAC